MKKEICPYCDQPAEWVENKEIYGKNYGRSYMVWLCRPCDAYVGCHNNTKKPLGTLADKETRFWRKEAHKTLDPIWKSKKLNRVECYARLGYSLGGIVHIGESDIETCKRIIEIVRTWKV